MFIKEKMGKIENSRTGKTNRRMNKFFKDMDESIFFLSYEDQMRMKFVEHLLSKLQIYDLDRAKIYLRGVDARTIKYLIYSILLDYDNKHWMS